MKEPARQSVDSETPHRANVTKDETKGVLSRIGHSGVHSWKHALQPLPVSLPASALIHCKGFSIELELASYDSVECGGMTVSPRWMDQDDPQPGAYLDLVGEEVLRRERSAGRRAVPWTSR
jgi:hypothetical protein